MENNNNKGELDVLLDVKRSEGAAKFSDEKKKYMQTELQVLQTLEF
ncbi:hypothetical protein [Tenacibaculum aquimarinum]|nr:hypothetical protein [Tenacibaculum aquimarinum]MCH3883843.1 hypothetical protein [Tenacibaculum aquimarinum]